MKWLLYILLLSSTWLSNNSIETVYRLQIKLTGIKSSKGYIRVAIFNNEESYKTESTSYKTIVVPAKSDQMNIQLDNIKPGDYAIAIYHDSNSNGKLDKGLFGAPSEYYGFSNNARGSFGKPEYKQCLIKVYENKVIDIKLR